MGLRLSPGGRRCDGPGRVVEVRRGWGLGRCRPGWGRGECGRGGAGSRGNGRGAAASRCLSSGGRPGRAQLRGAGPGSAGVGQDEQHQERAGAGAEPQAGPQPGGRARAVRQDPGERRGRGGRREDGRRPLPDPSPAFRSAGPAPRPLDTRPPPPGPPRAQVNRKRARATGAEVTRAEMRLGTEVAGRRGHGDPEGGGPKWAEADLRQWARWGQGVRSAQVRAPARTD